MERKVYIIDHVDCANCAAKIEAKFNALPEVEEATITFATKQLRITAENPDALLEKLTEIARTVETGATITPRDVHHRGHHHAHHDHECSCGHHHEHHSHECGETGLCPAGGTGGVGAGVPQIRGWAGNYAC